ncbi:MAG: hypothetical protein IKQ72_01735 [Bacteroidaceae bacterium]|nr:hypothetical protein [Bacteroidaceae bacterium]
MMTIEEIQARKECQTFDCKSIQIAPKALGEGIDRICSELETKGCAIPSFHADAFILKATLMAEWTSEKEFDRSSTVQVNDTVKVPVNNAELTDRQRKIYEIIKSGTVNGMVSGTVNAQNLSVALGISLRTTKRDLYVLRDMNLIQYVGSNKTGHWEVIKGSN